MSMSENKLVADQRANTLISEDVRKMESVTSMTAHRDLISEGAVGEVADRVAKLDTLGREEKTTICQTRATQEVEVLLPSLRERPEPTEHGSNWRHDRTEDIHLRWPSIIAALVRAAQDDHMQAFSMVLEDGFGVAPWTAPESMSFKEMVRRGNGHEVAPTWAIESLSMRRCPNCGEDRCVHMVCARCGKCDRCALVAGSAQELNR